MTGFKPFSINIRGRLVRYDRPAVMGIINVTPDSFYAGSRRTSEEEISRRTAEMVSLGADMIDLGAYSSRPGAAEVDPDEETRRLEAGLRAIRAVSADIPVSVDTFLARVAEEAVTNLGADIVNDISGGDLDPEMLDTVARLKAPYILMHMRGTPRTMQSMTEYPSGVTNEVLLSLAAKLHILNRKGVADVIIDPGLGFAKTLEQNYTLLSGLEQLTTLERPVLVGASRKSMITKALGITPEEALNGTTVVNTLALDRGASILRVHDVPQAVEAVKIFSML